MVTLPNVIKLVWAPHIIITNSLWSFFVIRKTPVIKLNAGPFTHKALPKGLLSPLLWYLVDFALAKSPLRPYNPHFARMFFGLKRPGNSES
jgi:hypothetical protein